MIRSQVIESVDAASSEDEARIILLASTAAEGDEGAFAELYGLLSQRVFNLVLRSVRDRPTAEDLCQEIWLRVHREIRGLRAPEAMRSWLYRIASRACVDFARSSRGKHRKEEDGIDEFVAAFGQEPEETAIVGSEVRLVWQTLGSMAPRQSIALYLKQVDGLSYDEIAAVLECSRPTVEALLFRARQSFVRAYRRVESSPEERCEMFAQVMASVIDHEPTALQRSALESHAADCVSCRPQLAEMRRANNAYLALPLIPIGETLAIETILAGGGAVAGAGIFSAAAGLLGAGVFQAKVVLVGAVIVTAAGGAVATGQIDVPVVSEHVAFLDPGEETATQAIVFKPDPAGETDPALLTSSSGALPGASTDNGPSPSLAGPAASGSPSPPRSPLSLEAFTAPDGSKSAGETGEAGVSGSPGAGSDVSAASGPAVTPSPTETLVIALGEAAQGVTGFVGETVEELAGVAGDTITAVTQPVTQAIEPVDNVVEDLTGLSVNETLEDVTNALPGTNSTPVPLDETVEDVLEPVENIVQDPLQPVENVLQDPLAPVEDLTEPVQELTEPVEDLTEPVEDLTEPVEDLTEDLTEPVEDLTDPLLDPLLPDPTMSPEATPPDDDPCVLGLLLC